MKQTTIAKPVGLVGIGLHKGTPVRLRLEPLEADAGIVFYRSDVNKSIALRPEKVVDTRMATVIGEGGVTVSTIEHLLSAAHAYGIDNLRVVLDADEVPVMDGSSAAYCLLLDEAGIRELSAPRRILQLRRTVEVRDGDKFARLVPADERRFDFRIRFDHPVIAEQNFSFDFTRQTYREEISRARTFGFVHEVQYLRSKGLALGGSLENVIVLDDKKVLNPEGLRFGDEFVRHKILDAIGDMALVGMPILGRYEAYAGSHALNHQLTVALLAEAANYEIAEFSAAEMLAPAKAYA